MRLTLTTAAAAVSAMFMIAGTAANAETKMFKAELTGAASVPPTDSAATGTVELTVDTDAKTVTWDVKVEGLSGEPTASHIHGPASASETAGPVIDTLAEMAGSAPITEEQVSLLEGGKYYYNVHTEKYPDGEVRGQLMTAE